LYDADPTSEIVDIKNLNFGSKHKGKHRVWTFKFTTDREDSYAEDGNRIKLLVDDLHQVPVIEKLTETINISKAVFDLQDPHWKNTTVELITIPEENTNVNNN
jgi:ferric iron reductase protein FhuF